MNSGNSKMPILVAAIIVIAVVFGGISLTRNLGSSTKTINVEKSKEKLAKYMKKIDPYEGNPVRGTLEYSDEDTTYQELPEVTPASIAVDKTSGYYAEIFSSSEKTGSGTDGYLREMAEGFNNAGIEVNGQRASVLLRTISSGQQVDYVSSGKYVPDAISPSSDLSVKMLNARGVATENAMDSIVENYAGIVVSKSTYSTLVEDYGAANVQNVAKATADGRINMGYTNPFTSATGLNFLITLLDSYSSGNILSDTAKNEFSAFQNNVPFVAMTTGQMRNAADKGSLDAFVLEYQTFLNDANLKKNYMFIPFGYVHSNPLAMIASVSQDKKDILLAFAKYCEENGSALASKDGFNQVPEGYTAFNTQYTGNELLLAQQFYKENKDAAPVICVFVADISGSMSGEPINTLKSSLVNSMQYINDNNYIGLVSYSDDVTIELPIAQFDMNQQSFFKGTVEMLDASGGTATHNAICVALDMIQKKQEEIPDTKAMVFVLSDGETNRGYSLNEVSDIISGLQVPIYTIGYNADIDALKEIANINEAACINASTEDVTYQLKQLFNANM